MSKKAFTTLALLVITSLVLVACGAPSSPTTPGEAPSAEAGCSDAIGCVEVGPGESLEIAYALTVSGATAFLGEDSRGAIEIAVAEWGEIHGHAIALSGEDTGCNIEGGQAAGVRLAAQPNLLAVIGTNCSSEAVGGLPAISEAGLLMCSPSNTAPGLTDPNENWAPGYFRTAHNDLFQGRVAAEFAYNELGARTAATIHDGSPYAEQLQAVFASVFAELGGTVTFQGAVNENDTDMRAILTSIAADSPDALYYPIFEPAGNFITAQSSEISGLEDTVLMGADGLFADGFPGRSGPNSVGMYLSGPYVAAGSAYDDFLGKWADQIGGVPPSGFHAHAYDCTNMVLTAIQSVAQVGADGTLLIGRQALRDAMSATSGFAGLTGNLTCNEYGDCATGEALAVFEITQAELDGNWPPPVVYQP
ncbi:MAG: branched-chain amino acid ABC transporter substrate-binding protein [Anaerolineales bacterium]|nr:branched-chain amino acid ABC transporter substrate-binding protein [Anaerolineales bacterium]